MNIFGSNYVEVDNDKDVDVINSNVYKKIVSLQRKPYTKQKAKDWVRDELLLKKMAGQRERFCVWIVWKKKIISKKA